jgi:hypothetical protein
MEMGRSLSEKHAVFGLTLFGGTVSLKAGTKGANEKNHI